MMKRFGFLFVLMVAVLAALSYWLLPRVQYNADIMALFPEEGRTAGVSHANRLISSAVTNRVFFLLSSSDWQATKAAAPAFAANLRECDCIGSVVLEQDVARFSRLRQHYLQFAPVLLSEKDRVLLQQGQGEALVTSALRDIMANPAGLSSEALLQDPFGTAQDYLAQLQGTLARRGIIEDSLLYFTDDADDRRYLLVMATIEGSPYSVKVQETVAAAISSAVSWFEATVPNPEVISTGAFFFARAGTQQAQDEISTVGLGSMLGIILLFLLVFRSPTSLFLALLPIGAGVLAGLLVCQLVFGSVHIFALVFGASLIGVAVDYALHFLCKRQAMENAWKPQRGLRALLPGLTMGLVTTVAGYLSFTAAGFPGFLQIALFSGVGLLAAYLVVVGFYPWALYKPTRNRAPQWVKQWLPRYLAGARQQLRRLRHPEIAVPLLFLASVAIWQLEVQDDVRLMQTPDAQLRAEEERLRGLVGSTTALQYLLVNGETQDELLQQLEQLQEPLQRLIAAGAISGATNLSQWLPSRASQKMNNTLLREQVVNSGLLQVFADTLGLKPTARQRLENHFSSAERQFLTINNTLPLIDSLIEKPLYFAHDGQHYSIVLLDGLANPDRLELLAQGNENVTWVDPVATTNRLLKRYRTSASLVLAGAYLLIWLLLSIRYGWKGAFSAVAPPLLASLTALSMLAVLGLGLSVFNVMALLLVLGIGIDYSLFLRESGGEGYDTLFAIGLSALTTLLSFGLLSLSATHAIFSFGLTVLMGIVMSFIFAPLSLPVVSSTYSSHKR